MKKLILSVFALAAIALSANAQVNTSTTGGVSAAKLQAPIQVSAATTGDVDNEGTSVLNGNVLDFGIINIDADGGAVSVNELNVFNALSSGMTQDAAGLPSAAGFKIAGTVGLTYVVSVVDGGDMTNGTTDLTLSNFTNSATGTVGATVPSNTFLVGGRLNIPANATVGTYAGTFNVTVAYN